MNLTTVYNVEAVYGISQSYSGARWLLKKDEPDKPATFFIPGVLVEKHLPPVTEQKFPGLVLAPMGQK